MYPFRNILFPTDFSQNARTALKYAVAFARNDDGRVVVLNVQTSRVPTDLLNLPDEVFEEQDRQWLLQVRSEARELLRDPLLENVDVESAFAEGEPAAEIARAALDHGIDLVTVVTRSRRGLSRAFGGSVAEEIIAESPCAVLAIRPAQREFIQDHEGCPRIRLKRVLLATNFRPSSAAAALLARHISNHMGAELHAVYVIGDYFDRSQPCFQKVAWPH